jgi:hypothetical protein
MAVTRNQKLDLHLNSIEEIYVPAEFGKSCVPLMIDAAALVEARMPPVATYSLRVARDYAAGTTSAESVNDAIVRCWKDLGGGGRDMCTDVPDVAAIRAVICILRRQVHPEAEDSLDLLSFFVELLNNVEPHSEELEALFKKHFPLHGKSLGTTDTDRLPQTNH